MNTKSIMNNVVCRLLQEVFTVLNTCMTRLLNFDGREKCSYSLIALSVINDFSKQTKWRKKDKIYKINETNALRFIYMLFREVHAEVRHVRPE